MSEVMGPTPDWEAINVAMFADLPKDRQARIKFQHRGADGKSEHPVIVAGVLQKTYKGKDERWYVDIEVESTQLVTDIKAWSSELSELIRWAIEHPDEPLLELGNEIDIPPELSSKTFALSEIIAPVFGFTEQ